jgi:polyisoprenoid-binding protein YceI
LPDAPPDQGQGQGTVPELVSSWRVAPPSPDDPPQVIFRFPAPIDHYIGEVKKVTGSLTFDEDLALSSAKGSFAAHVASITMGEADLDDALQGAIFFHARKYPTVTFTLASVSSDQGKPIFGILIPTRLKGSFTIKDATIPLSLPAEIEAVVRPDEQPGLILRGTFEIDLNRFEIEKADGPTPANHTVLVDVHLTMSP